MTGLPRDGYTGASGRPAGSSSTSGCTAADRRRWGDRFLVEQTNFERPNARPGHGHHPCPTTRCRTCSADTAPRPAPSEHGWAMVQPQGLPRPLMRSGSLPIGFHRRLRGRGLTACESSGYRPQARPIADRVWPRPGRDRHADRPPRPDRGTVRGPGRTGHPSRRLRRRAVGCAGQPRGTGSRRVARRRTAPGGRRRRHGRGDPARVRGGSHPRRADDGDRRPPG